MDLGAVVIQKVLPVGRSELGTYSHVGIALNMGAGLSDHTMKLYLIHYIRESLLLDSMRK